MSLPAPLDTINVHLRAGYVIPLQVPGLDTGPFIGDPHGCVQRGVRPQALGRGGRVWVENERVRERRLWIQLY